MSICPVNALASVFMSCLHMTKNGCPPEGGLEYTIPFFPLKGTKKWNCISQKYFYVRINCFLVECQFENLGIGLHDVNGDLCTWIWIVTTVDYQTESEMEFQCSRDTRSDQGWCPILKNVRSYKNQICDVIFSCVRNSVSSTVISKPIRCQLILIKRISHCIP